MTKPVRTFNIYPWIIVAAGVLVFCVVVFARQGEQLQMTPLEAMIAENEPKDHVHAVGVSPNGETFVGTHLGLVQGQGQGEWRKVAGLSADTMAIVTDQADSLYLAVANQGVVHFVKDQLVTLLSGDARALAGNLDQQPIFVAYLAGSGLHKSVDGGQTWAKLADPGTSEVLSIAIDPQDTTRLVVGGLQGFVAHSTDGGKSWMASSGLQLQGTISALVFDPSKPGRIWAASGGAPWVSDDRGNTWRRITPGQSSDRTIVGLAVSTKGKGPLAITSEGFMFTLDKS